MQNCAAWPSSSAAAAAAQYQMSNSCMSPQSTVPSFMGLTHHQHAAAQGLAAAAAAAAAASQGMTHAQAVAAPPNGAQISSGSHNHPAHHTSSPPAHLAASMTQSTCQSLDPYQDTDRRSSSIAALRLKAREHSAAMGVFSAYGK